MAAKDLKIPSWTFSIVSRVKLKINAALVNKVPLDPPVKLAATATPAHPVTTVTQEALDVTLNQKNVLRPCPNNAHVNQPRDQLDQLDALVPMACPETMAHLAWTDDLDHKAIPDPVDLPAAPEILATKDHLDLSEISALEPLLQLGVPENPADLDNPAHLVVLELPETEATMAHPVAQAALDNPDNPVKQAHQAIQEILAHPVPLDRATSAHQLVLLPVIKRERMWKDGDFVFLTTLPTTVFLIFLNRKL